MSDLKTKVNLNCPKLLKLLCNLKLSKNISCTVVPLFVYLSWKKSNLSVEHKKIVKVILR